MAKRYDAIDGLRTYSIGIIDICNFDCANLCYKQMDSIYCGKEKS